jgi:hypothetical protein
VATATTIIAIVQTRFNRLKVVSPGFKRSSLAQY